MKRQNRVSGVKELTTPSTSSSIPPVRIRIRTWLYNYRVIGEVNSGPSLTQPNEVMSIQEIIARSQRGLPLGAGDPGFYDEPDGMDLPEGYDSMDKFDKEMFRRDHADRVNEARADATELHLPRKDENQPPEPAPAASGPRSGPSEDTPG